MLRLGFLIRREEQERASDRAQGSRKYSEPAQTTEEKLAEYDQKVAQQYGQRAA